MDKEKLVADLHNIVVVLHPGQILLLTEMARAMTRQIKQHINPQSDILVPAFATNFSNRLLIHHATHEEKLKKKSFEYAFCAAARAAGRQARIVSSQTNPGADVIIDSVKFSLKTEAAAGINPKKITISKLMEARWIRECRTQVDFARETTTKVVAHLHGYERIITLRAFDMGENINYQMVEIPLSLLQAIGTLKPEDFTPRTSNGSSRANVSYRGQPAFSVILDGSVEKITVSNLDVGQCIPHGFWVIPAVNTQIEAT